MQKLDNYAQFENIGMNRMSSPFNIKKGEWKMIINADVSKIGVITKRLGYKKILDAPDGSGAEVLNLIPYEIEDAGKLIMINSAGKAYASSDLTVGSGSWGTAIATGLSATARWGWAVLGAYLFMGNGAMSKKVDADAASMSDVPGMPVFKFATTLYQRLYCGGVNASPSTLFWSETGDGTGWSSVAPHDSSSTDIEKNWKGNIKGLGFSNDRIVIFKDRIMKRWDSDYMKTVMDSDGIKAPYSLADVSGMLLSLNQDCINIYDGNAPQEISSPIQDIIDGIDFSPTNINRICGVVYKKKYYLNVGNITLADGTVITNAVIVYDFRYNTFVLYSLGHQMTAIAKLVKTDGTEKLYMGDVNGNVYEMFNGYTDDGNAIEMQLETHVIYPYDGGYTVRPKTLTTVTDVPDSIGIKMAGDTGDLKELDWITNPSQNITIGDEIGEVNGWRLSFSHIGASRPSLYGWSLDFLLSDKRI